eukprot:gene20097-26094_t
MSIKQKGIFFDIDGTLSDSFQLGYSSTLEVLRRNNKADITVDEYHYGTRFSTPNRFAWHLTRDPNNELGIIYGKQFDELYTTLVSTETTPLYDGIRELLYNLKKNHQNIHLAALSNACGQYARNVIKCNNLDDIIPIALGADDVPKSKPNPDGLLMICNQLSLKPEDCVYIGDSPTDGQAALASGMRSIGVTWGSHSIETIKPKFDKIVTTVDDLVIEIDNFIN